MVKIYYSIGMVKHYYRPLQQVYSIFIIKILSIKLNLVLQMFFKVINNSMSFNGLVFTLPVFSIYLRIIKLDALSLSIIQCAIAMKKIIDKV